jgi:tRNA dimethylallyltransferase
MQVYRGMDIGTAKPSAEERERLAHHLIDIRNPDEQFNTGDFVRLATEACGDILGRGAIPVVSGGTGFYIKNFICGLPEAPPSDPEIREQLRTELKQNGVRPLMDELAAGDPVSAGRIHINDTYRLLRALEVLRLTGLALSSFAVSGGATAAPLADSVPARKGTPPFSFLIIALSRPRDELYRRINMRCESMFANGLPEEVKRLFEAGYTPDDPGLRAIGYREFFIRDDEGVTPPPVDGKGGGYRISGDTEGVKALVAQNSRRYAKRQLTFFSGIPGVRWIEAHDDAEAAQRVRREIDLFLESVARG